LHTHGREGPYDNKDALEFRVAGPCNPEGVELEPGLQRLLDIKTERQSHLGSYVYYSGETEDGDQPDEHADYFVACRASGPGRISLLAQRSHRTALSNQGGDADEGQCLTVEYRLCARLTGHGLGDSRIVHG
jgi:hypothetical protein